MAFIALCAASLIRQTFRTLPAFRTRKQWSTHHIHCRLYPDSREVLAYYSWAKLARRRASESSTTYHDNTNTSPLRRVRIILGMHATGYQRSAVIVKVVMQLPVSCTEPLLLEKQWVIKKGQRIEYVEICLFLVSVLAWIRAEWPTRFAKIKASSISKFILSFKPFSSFTNAVSVA